MSETITNDNGSEMEYAEVQVNDFVNGAFIDGSTFIEGNVTLIDPNTVFLTESGELLYVIPLDSQEGTPAQGLQYYMVKNEVNNGEIVNQSEVEDQTSLDFESANGQYEDGGTQEAIPEENTVEEGGEEILSSIQVTKQEDVKVHKDFMPTRMDFEQATAANNLLEFRNQQPFMQSETVDDGQPTTECESADADPLEGTSELDDIKFIPSSKPMKTYSKPKAADSDDSTNTRQNGSLQTTIIVPTEILKMAPAYRRKRRIIYDIVKVISNSEFKKQLQDTSDIAGKVELAPSTKKAMSRLAYGGIGKYFAHPGRRVQSTSLSQLFYSRLTMKIDPQPNEVLDRNEPLKPLDPELRTPASSLVHALSVSQQDPEECLTAVVKRTMEEFDQMIKGMNSVRAKRLEKLRNVPESAQVENCIVKQERVD